MAALRDRRSRATGSRCCRGSCGRSTWSRGSTRGCVVGVAAAQPACSPTPTSGSCGPRGATREARIDAARDAWYRGWVAEAMVVRACSRLDDLAGFSATVEAPVSFDFRGWTVFKTGPWGQGPVFLQQLALLEGFELGEFLGVEHVHTVIECAKLAFADREAWYGDSAPVPLELLLSRDVRRASGGRWSAPEASGELRPGGPDPRLPVIGTRRADARDRRADARRHLPSRRRRPVREPRERHAERRLAAELAGAARSRLLPRDARADVLARAGPARVAGAGSAAADDALAVAGGARGRHGAVVRHAGRRPAGPVVARVLPRPCGVRPGPAGGDRRADVPHHPLPELVLSARGRAAAGGDRGARAGGDDRGVAGARARRRGHRRLVARAALGASPALPTACCAPPRTRAECRATRSVVTQPANLAARCRGLPSDTQPP